MGVVGAGARLALGRSSRPRRRPCRGQASPNIGGLRFVVDRTGSVVASGRARAAWLPGAPRRRKAPRRAGRERREGARRSCRSFTGAGRAEERARRFRVLVGLPEPRPGRPADLDGAVARAFEKNPRWGRASDRQGSPSSLEATPRKKRSLAIEQAAWPPPPARSEAGSLPRRGRRQLSRHRERCAGSEETDRLHAAAPRPWEFTPGEAAGFCLLASEGLARGAARRTRQSRSWPCRPPTSRRAFASRTGCASAPRLTAAFTTARSAPLRRGGPARGAAHRRSERRAAPRSTRLGFALSRTADAFAAPGDVLVPAQYWGDVGAASGALFAGLAFAAATGGHTTGLSTLIWASSEGGARAAALLSAPPPSSANEEP